MRGMSATPPDGQQNHLRRLDPEAPRHEDVAEFVEDDTGEDERNEEHAVARGRKPSLLPGTDADPSEEEKECEMNPHGRCTEAADRQGPGHWTCSSSISHCKLCAWKSQGKK